MRLPLTKIYRAFPELDPFTDQQCTAYLATAKQRHRVRTQLGALVAILVMLFAWTFIGTVFGLSAATLPRRMQTQFGWDLLFAIGFGTVVFLGALCGLWVRDRWLRWLVRMELSEAKCPDCDYSLLGLRIESGSVMCPECGGVWVLEELGLTPADLIAEVGAC
jgi:ribosomal protein L37AE/L43A